MKTTTYVRVQDISELGEGFEGQTEDGTNTNTNTKTSSSHAESELSPQKSVKTKGGGMREEDLAAREEAERQAKAMAGDDISKDDNSAAQWSVGYLKGQDEGPFAEW